MLNLRHPQQKQEEADDENMSFYVGNPDYLD
jgi:hypothetical protein